MSSSIQRLVHDLEQGKLRTFILQIGFVALVLGLVAMYLFLQFRGLGTETAMDQAQIGRNLATGRGFTTQYIRPMAMWQFLTHADQLPSGGFPDTYNAPLMPLINAMLLWPVRHHLQAGMTDVIFLGDRILAAAGMACFLLSLLVLFFLARSLFDRRIAWLGTLLALLTDILWQFSLSGLSQMFLLLCFSLVLWCTHAAMMAQVSGRTLRVMLLLAASAFLFGLMALAHFIALWLFVGYLIFVCIYFTPRVINALMVLLIVTAMVTPWLVRNHQLTGNPLGLGIYNALAGTLGPEYVFMGSLEPDMSAIGAVKAKVRRGLTAQLEEVFAYLGYNVAAAAFFLSLLHVFRRRETSMLRWLVVMMWVFAVLGMSVFNPEGPVSSNQIHVLFLPFFIFYGLAFLLVLWNRLEIDIPQFRQAFIALIILLTALPLLLKAVSPPPLKVNWPPYVPPFIAAVGQWMDPNEILCSDMPWAMAWYADRRTLLLPVTIRQFNIIHDYKYLGGPVGGLYLTPVSGDQPFISQIARGQYKDWSGFIMRTADLTKFPLQFFTPLPIDNQCVFYSNRDRWTPRTDL